ncbi:hypothetical protein EDC18_11115 [Natranaerovirga pectinivora]|uniref:ParB-like nuclease family protein n=1 Tax=Natranaerovirga pectinivora TaxID=682400 RepID=A0A4R3MGF8_9FIRM|nr:hypothetical protein [Natranaerovirga pectinivora]TCT12844.1 hypothetical protein EDC18_11115 [Natranaerovirga pectinivora]
MNNIVQIVSLHKIIVNESLHLNISSGYIKRMDSFENALLPYDLFLPVEKCSTENQYVLVGGYDKYKYMLDKGIKKTLCIIEPSTNYEEQQIKFLRRLYNNGDATKENRQKILDLIPSFRIDYVLKKIGLSKNEYNINYQYNPNIPSEYININTSEIVMNWIEQLNIHNNVKVFLYKRAGLPKGDPLKFTTEHMKLLKKFFKLEPRFYQLDVNYQIEILKSSIYYKGTILELLRSMVERV